MRTVGLGEVLVLIVMLVALGFPFWRIAKKMGYPGVVGLIALVPGVNLLLVYFIALSEWPVLRDLGLLKRQVNR